MFDEIKDFIAKHKIWFIICGIICAMFGAVMAALISLYFLIAVAVGLIVAVLPGLMQQPQEYYEAIQQINTKIKVYDKNVNIVMERRNELNQKIRKIDKIQTVDEYKNAVKQIITTDYIDSLSTGFYAVDNSFTDTIKNTAPDFTLRVEYEKKIKYDSCDILLNDFRSGEIRGNECVLFFIKQYFALINLNTISSNYKIAIRGNVEALFEVLTGEEYGSADVHDDREFSPLQKFNNLFTGGFGSYLVRKAYCEKIIKYACDTYNKTANRENGNAPQYKRSSIYEEIK